MAGTACFGPRGDGGGINAGTFCDVFLVCCNFFCSVWPCFDLFRPPRRFGCCLPLNRDQIAGFGPRGDGGGNKQGNCRRFPVCSKIFCAVRRCFDIFRPPTRTFDCGLPLKWEKFDGFALAEVSFRLHFIHPMAKRFLIHTNRRNRRGGSAFRQRKRSGTAGHRPRGGATWSNGD